MIFLDTSALLKRYVDETGSDLVIEQMAEDLAWVASSLARAEAEVTLCHLGLADAKLRAVRRRLRDDWDRFLAVPVDADCLFLAAELGCRHRIRTLDAIHLAAASRLPTELTFLSFDRQQAAVAQLMGFYVPT